MAQSRMKKNERKLFLESSSIHNSQRRILQGERERGREGKREVKSIISNSNKLQAAPSVFAEHSNLKIIKLSLIFHEKACARYSSKGCIMEMIKLHLQTQKYANHFPFS